MEQLIGIRSSQNGLREICSRGARDFSEKDWPQHSYEGNSETTFEYCVNSENSLMYIRAIQGHTGENMIAELMGQVAIFPASGKRLYSTEVVLSTSSPTSRQDHCTRKRKQGGKTNNLLHTSPSFWGQIRRRNIQ